MTADGSPAPVGIDLESETGRGLGLVAALADRSWLCIRNTRELDLADIGRSPSRPHRGRGGQGVSTRYAFLAELDPDERQLAAAHEPDRNLAALVTELPEERLARICPH